jgi:hypothetical protein
MDSGGEKMGREYEERLFSEKLDRMLAGQEIQIDGAVDNDLRTALDFARKMTSLRTTPSSRFKAHLKARLLQRIDEQEARSESRRGWFSRLIRQPVWQAVAVMVFMIVVGGVIWGSGVFNPSRPPIVNAPTPAFPATSAPPMTSAAPAISSAPATSAAPAATAPALQGLYLAASGSTDKSSYLPGEKVSIHMEWQNVTSQNLTINEYPPILSIMDKSTGQAVYTFQAGKTAITLAPGQRVDYIEPWDQLDAQGRPVAPGSYYLELEEMYYQGRAVPMTLTRPVSFTIY